MSNIANALGYLFQSLETLESATQKHEQAVGKLKLRMTQNAQQQDLFNAQSTAKVAKPDNNVHVIDPSLLARKLDKAIEKIEQVLNEA